MRRRDHLQKQYAAFDRAMTKADEAKRAAAEAETCDLHCTDPNSTSCEDCRPCLHDQDCSVCDGHKEAV